jgi:hypothetical protein
MQPCPGVRCQVYTFFVMPGNLGYGRVRSFAGTPLSGIVNAGVCVTAAIAVVACWVSWAMTFPPWAQHLPSALFVPFFVLMFPLFGWSVWLQTAARRPAGARRASAGWMNAIPRGGRVLVALAAAAAAASWSTAASALGGQPGYDPATHRYVLNDHGNLTPVSTAAYLHALAAQNRLFLGVTLVFLTVAFGVTYGDWSRHRPQIRAVRRLPRPASPRPWIPVPVPVLALTAAAALAAAVASGLLITDRVSAWSSHAIYLHPGHPVAARLAPGHYTVFAGCTQDMRCAHLAPASVTIRSTSREVDVVPDLSSDHDSEGNGQPFTGELSFSIPRTSAVQIELTAPAGQPVFVVPSEGQQARALAGWIVLAGAALLTLLVSLAGLGRLAWWRLTPALCSGPLPAQDDLTGSPGSSQPVTGRPRHDS